MAECALRAQFDDSAAENAETLDLPEGGKLAQGTIGVAKLAGAAVVATLCVACAAGLVAKPAACAPVAATAQARLEIFDRPFAGTYPVGSTFDHDLPILAEDRNNYLLNSCGQRVNGVKGHTGVDWPMANGTPLLAVADGRIVRAEQEAVTCGGKPGPGAKVVVIETRPNGSDVFRAGYGHLDRIDVAVGDSIRAGDVIGTSGNTGCSTAPHLHFEVTRMLDGREIRIDPYGWHSQTLVDPWSADTRGTRSLWLWRSGAGPTRS